jgi:hypothetical protein
MVEMERLSMRVFPFNPVKLCTCMSVVWERKVLIPEDGMEEEPDTHQQDCLLAHPLGVVGHQISELVEQD